MRAHGSVDPSTSTPLDRRLFGGFVEHLGRHIYDGIHEPSHPDADDEGFRRDVIELVRELGVSTIRYPGGNFVSGYRWEDGVGPRGSRPVRLDLAWHSTEPNIVGLHEFASWTRKVGAELMLAVNLGTRGTQEALDLLEYATVAVPTALTDRRTANGHPDPFAVRMWCLGNEMDGPWQLGHRNATDYGTIASRTAKGMRMLDPDVELVVCGSSGRSMPTFGSWERTVLEHTFDDVDFISCHAYYCEKDGNAQEFLASGVDMELFIDAVAATIDHVAALRRSTKRIAISFDEWNVWYTDAPSGAAREADTWPVAPRLLENVYSLLDAVVVGDLLITLLSRADRVHAASLAQLVNVIGPIMTEPGGPAWRQTTFHPFALTSRLAGDTVVRVDVDGPVFESSRFGTVPSVHAVATAGPDGVSVFLVNRSVTQSVDIDLDVAGLGTLRETHLLAGADRYATNSRAHPDRVVPRPWEGAHLVDGHLRATLPPISWAAVCGN